LACSVDWSKSILKSQRASGGILPTPRNLYASALVFPLVYND
jgi:hypothetical protein